ncbi:shikimate kinase [Thermogymnomonas acidicola]|uniref:Shikimate kinase n=1 Tax=Thermogymnomonas acidicola TaxID=399579 RepID=A0AA37BQJ4_9ARCH|nr:shikimate kinase [Thermogymnomonas acidicola]
MVESVRVHADAAVTVSCAFSGALGSAAKIDLPFTMDVSRGDPGELRGLSRECSRAFSVGGEFHFEVVDRIPEAQGLKSSSALVLSAMIGVSRLLGAELEGEELLRLCAEASVRLGLSVTGALDDLSAIYYGGVSVTDNASNRIIFTDRMPDLPVLVVESSDRRISYSARVDEYRKMRRAWRAVENLLMRREFLEAMVIDGYLCSLIEGSDGDAISTMLLNSATHACQSGKGPAVVGVFRNEGDMERCASILESKGRRVKRSRFKNSGIWVEHI